MFREADEVAEGLDFLAIYKLASYDDPQFEDPIIVDCSVNGKTVSMEVDTGAVVTIMSDGRFQRCSSQNLDSLEETSYRVRSFTGEIVKPLGVGMVDVEYEGQRCQCPVTVIKGDVPTLLGREWLKK